VSAKCILLIDDDLSTRQVTAICLRKLGGWTVLTSASGQEGLNQAITAQPDAILLDIMMPDMDGLSVLQALRNHPQTRSIPIIILTAKLRPNRDYSQLDIVGVIFKPFDALVLATQVAELLNW
jgi:CheY-like chemotaxis protein